MIQQIENGHELMPPERELEDFRGDGWYVDSKGRKFFPCDPLPSEFDIEDIAFTLSNLCRWGGKVEFISVAEHSCMVSDNCPTAYKLLGLLHEIDEAAMGLDCVRPLKYQLPELVKIGNHIWSVAAPVFGLPTTNPRDVPALKEADDRCLITERNQLMPAGPNTRNWYCDHVGLKPYDYRVQNWAPIIARREFMKRYNQLISCT